MAESVTFVWNGRSRSVGMSGHVRLESAVTLAWNTQGTRAPIVERRAGKRFIPAGAGNTGGWLCVCTPCSVHPRRRGEHERLNAYVHPSVGSSPQARGTQPLPFVEHAEIRFIPAGAGNTPDRGKPQGRKPVHPRRRGEHLSQWIMGVHPFGSSPQARGTQLMLVLGRRVTRFIPAGAGNTMNRNRNNERIAVHPRRRGEHPWSATSSY